MIMVCCPLTREPNRGNRTERVRRCGGRRQEAVDLVAGHGVGGVVGAVVEHDDADDLVAARRAAARRSSPRARSGTNVWTVPLVALAGRCIVHDQPPGAQRRVRRVRPLGRGDACRFAAQRSQLGRRPGDVGAPAGRGRSARRGRRPSAGRPSTVTDAARRRRRCGRPSARGRRRRRRRRRDPGSVGDTAGRRPPRRAGASCGPSSRQPARAPTIRAPATRRGRRAGGRCTR